MASINKVILIGNLTRDPELKATNGGQSVCRLSIATNRTWKNKNDEKQEEVEYHRVTVWGKTAEHCNQYLAKGRACYVEGRLKTSSFEKDGVKKWSTEIIAETVQFLGGRSDGDGQRGGSEPAPYDPGDFGRPPGDDGLPF